MSKKKIFSKPRPGDIVSDALTPEEQTERQEHELEATKHEREHEIAQTLPRTADAVIVDVIESNFDEEQIKTDLICVVNVMNAFCDKHQEIARLNGHLSFAKDFNALRGSIAHIKKHAERVSYWKKVN